MARVRDISRYWKRYVIIDDIDCFLYIELLGLSNASFNRDS